MRTDTEERTEVNLDTMTALEALKDVGLYPFFELYRLLDVLTVSQVVDRLKYPASHIQDTCGVSVSTSATGSKKDEKKDEWWRSLLYDEIDKVRTYIKGFSASIDRSPYNYFITRLDLLQERFQKFDGALWSENHQIMFRGWVASVKVDFQDRFGDAQSS